jgi:4-hydroxy-3-polyprenylbenzoate decarboxylase
MDVLDHSCSKFAFGGKMCVDATTKFEEEVRCAKQPDGAVYLDDEKVKALFGEISSINSSLLKLGISVVFIAVKKSRINHIKELHQNLFSLPDFAAVKIAIYVEHTINTSDIADCIWRFANNIDPKRDSFIIEGANESSISHIGFDGTRKTKELDNFHRDWPNILISDDATIKAIDEKWSSLNIGKFIQSPSLKYKKQVYKGGAVVSEK